MIACSILLVSCSDSNEDCCINPEQPQLIIKLKFDPYQTRLNNLGQPSTIPSGNAAQSPNIRRMSANYIEFTPSATTLLGNGELIFKGSETTTGGNRAINFQAASFAGNEETFISIPLNEVANGNYNWVRVSLAYQEGTINVRAPDGNDYSGTLASCWVSIPISQVLISMETTSMLMEIDFKGSGHLNLWIIQLKAKLL